MLTAYDPRAIVYHVQADGAKPSGLGRLDTPKLRADLGVEALERAILAGDLAPGERLVERDLALRFGVSKTPVREALKVLASRGLVSYRPYRGAEVITPDIESARDISQVRLLLEPQGVHQAVTAAGAVTIPLARSALREASDAAERADMASMATANRSFHRALFAACPNAFLRSLLDSIHDQLAIISVAGWRRTSTWAREGSEHHDILDAAERGDANAAAQRVAAHIQTFLTESLVEHARTEDGP
jgi:DNA-binding GntR family transcriptional regulator